MDDATRLLFEQLGISLVLGLLVGLQRQHAESTFAGLRTFPLITVLGTLAAVLDRQYEASGWVLMMAFVGVVTIVAITRFQQLRRENPDIGSTTEVAVLLMFAVGAFLVSGDRRVAIAVGAGVAVLLQFKGELHRLVQKLGEEELRAVMTFVLITCIILPVLPDKTYGPFKVLNPFDTWRMVVLMVGISLGGYLVYKFFGRNAGIVLGGLLGGAISSTATTISYAKRTANIPESTWLATLVIMIASTVVYVRVMIEVSVVAPRHFLELSLPVAVMMLTSLLAAAVVWLRVRREPNEMPEQTNPTELKSAIVFGGLYAGVLFALAAAKEYLGVGGIYAIAALSGLTDMDAITLSTARLVQTGTEAGGISASDGWKLIVIAAMSNLVFKAGIVAAAGHPQLMRRVTLLFLIPILTGACLLWLWPTVQPQIPWLAGAMLNTEY